MTELRSSSPGPLDPLSDAKVVDAWRKNSRAWSRAVRAKRIESRRLVTDQAIVDAVLGCTPRSVLDLGCGEGWLVRALSGCGVRAVGVDVVPELIATAIDGGGGEFRVVSYASIASGELDLRVDVVVANFSLIGHEAVEGVVRRVPLLLLPGGALIIQTLHPLVACGDLAYRDGWRPGSWAGCDGDFTDPAPWYFRTIESWVALVTSSGLRVRELREPLHPATQRPASLILIADAG